MNEKNAYIISLKFAPGLKKEFEVLGKNIRLKRINVKYLLSSEYAKLGNEYEGTEYVTKANGMTNIVLESLKFINSRKFVEIFSLYPPMFLCFYNPHPLNPFIARLVKRKFPEAIVAFYLHDPYKPNKNPYGTSKAAYIALVEFIQALTVKHMDHIISPSEYSAQLFIERYPKFKGKTHIAPLLIPDQRILNVKKSWFFSMVGTAHQATGHDSFIELINYVAAKELRYKFALISSSNISKYLKRLSERGRKILNVINREIITDSEINEIIRQSYAVFRLDREVTQSGVIPVCYMNATPVIVRDIPGLTQHVKNAETGYVIPYDCTPEDLVHSMEFVKDNYTRLSRIARMSYEEIWAEWNWDRYYSWLKLN